MDNFLEKILKQYATSTDIEAIAIGGSTTAKTSDTISDIDIYIFSKENIPIETRKNITKLLEQPTKSTQNTLDSIVDELKVVLNSQTLEN